MLIACNTYPSPPCSCAILGPNTDSKSLTLPLPRESFYCRVGSADLCPPSSGALLCFCSHSRNIQKNTKIWHFPWELRCASVMLLHPLSAKQKQRQGPLRLSPVSLKSRPQM